jgi:hypothetical protein
MVNHKKLSLALLMSLGITQLWGVGMEVPVMKPSHLAALRLMHENGKFSVVQEGKSEVIPSHDVSKSIRSISSEKLAKFLAKAGYLSLHQYNNGEYSVREHVRGEGGGLGLAWAFYCATKIGIYGAIAGAVAGTTAAVVASGGTAAPLLGAAGSTLGTAVGGIAGASTAATLGTAAVAGAVATSTTATTAVAGTVLAVGVTGGATAAGSIALIEGIAMTAFAAGLAMGPF